jgi:acylphosphatase
MSRIAVRVVIAGRAQGVGYRYWAVAEAERLGVDGWAQNRGDGAVEALFAGPPEAVRAMITACREGPRFAAVAEISEFPADAPDAPGFRQMR